MTRCDCDVIESFGIRQSLRYIVSSIIYTRYLLSLPAPLPVTSPSNDEFYSTDIESPSLAVLYFDTTSRAIPCDYRLWLGVVALDFSLADRGQERKEAIGCARKYAFSIYRGYVRLSIKPVLPVTFCTQSGRENCEAYLIAKMHTVFLFAIPPLDIYWMVRFKLCSG